MLPFFLIKQFFAKCPQYLCHFKISNSSAKFFPLVPTEKAYFPSIEQCSFWLGYFHQGKTMSIYNRTIDSAMSTSNVERSWTNRRDVNRMKFMFYSMFSPSTFNFPSRPNYITKYAFGITKADVNVVVTNSNNEGLYKIGTNIERHLKKKTNFLYDFSY